MSFRVSQLEFVTACMGASFGFAYPWALLSRVHCLDKRSPLSVTLKSTDGWGSLHIDDAHVQKCIRSLLFMRP